MRASMKMDTDEKIQALESGALWANAEEGVTTGSEESCRSFALELLSFVKQCVEFRAGTKSVEPGIANHRGITEKATIDGARQHFESLVCRADITQLPA